MMGPAAGERVLSRKCLTSMRTYADSACFIRLRAALGILLYLGSQDHRTLGGPGVA